MPRISSRRFSVCNGYGSCDNGAYRPSRLSRALPLVAAAWCLLLGALTAGAQTVNVQSAQNAVDSRRRGSAEIDPVTLGLQLRITLGDYPGRGGAGLPVTLYYSSKLWRIKHQDTTSLGSQNRDFGPEYDSRFRPMYAESSAAGWTSSLDWFRWPSPDPPGPEKYDINGKLVSGTTYDRTVARMYVTLPDGSRHELRRDDAVLGAGSDTAGGTFYSVDGSRLRYDAAARTLFMPDGSRLVTETDPNGVPLNLRHVDRNGNRSTYDYSTGQWTDTLGRTFTLPLPTKAGVAGQPAAGDYVYSLPGVGTTSIDYTFRWSNLSDALLPDANGQAPPLRYKGDRTLAYPHTPVSPSLFTTFDDQFSVVSDGAPFNPVVLSQIALPDGTAYTFKYNVWGEVVRIDLPTGGYEAFSYDAVSPLSGQLDDGLYSQANRGVTRHTLSDGVTTSTWSYGTVVDTGTIPYRRGRKVTAPDLSYTETYYHDSRGADIKFGFDDARVGRPYDARAYSPSGQMLRRKLTRWDVTGPVPYDNNSTATRNGRATKEVEVLLDTGAGAALAKVTTYEYNPAYETTTGANLKAVNEYDYYSLDRNTAQTAGVDSFAPPAQWLRRAEYDYLDDENAAYRDRNLLGLKKETRVKDSSGAVVARSVVGYDQDAVEDCPQIINHDANYGTDFGPRGNATSMTSYAAAAAMTGAVTTSAYYDIAGNAVSATDANGNTSTVSYADNFSDLGNGRHTYTYPTLMTTAAPNASAVPKPSPESGYFAAGTFGSTAGLTSSTVYDFSTGRVIQTTDANGRTTSYDYTDPLNRLKRVDLPDGGRTSYNYVDAHQCGPYVETRTLLDGAGREAKSWQFFDGLGRPYLSETYENQDPANVYLRADTGYDSMGRVSQVSAPYRSSGCTAQANPSGLWTTTEYDARGRVSKVTTPDGAKVYTLYDGLRTLVTDQAGKQRIARTDALGRLAEVWEVRSPDAATGTESVSFPIPNELATAIPAVSAGYRTAYTYDTLGNLRKVDQGGQLRFFIYDSLGRLTRAKNPEQAVNTSLAVADPVTGNGQWAVAYGYDNNGNLTTRTDARGVQTTYTYDGLNRNILVHYAGGGTSTPDVRRYYDQPGAEVNGLGRPWWTETVGLSATVIDGYDEAGRPKEQTQKFWVGTNWGPQAYTTKLTYNLAGGVTSQEYPSTHKVWYQYDAAGRLGDNGGLPAFKGTLGDSVERTYSSQITYGEFGGLRQERFGTQVPLYHKRHYNRRGQLFDIRLSTASWAADEWNWNRGAILNYYGGNYAWEGEPATPASADNNGNLRRQKHLVPADDQMSGHTFTQQTYEYDALNRLSSVTEAAGANGTVGPDSFKQAYDYDRWGNRTINAAATQVFGQNPGYTIPEPQFAVDQNTNRLGVPAGHSGQMNYDAAGNLINDSYSPQSSGDPTGQQTRFYDAEGRMTTAQAGASQTARYAYDADGRRVKRLVGTAGEVWQVYGLGGELLAEYAAAASPTTPQKEYGYRGGELLVTAESAAAGWGPAPAFYENPLNPNHSGETPVRARHITELRAAIDSLRGHEGLPAYGWSPTPVKGDPVTITPITEMRAALDEALGAPPQGYSAGLARWQPILAVHIQELRGRVLEAWQSGGGAADIRWLVSDQLGTPRMVVDKTGSLAGVTRHDYLPFGEELFAGTGGRADTQGYSKVDNVRQKFTGYARDTETSLDYAQARYYANAQGRFTSVDPLMASGRVDNPQTLNRYGYVGNNPLNLTDPSGMCPECPDDEPPVRTDSYGLNPDVWIARIGQRLYDYINGLYDSGQGYTPNSINATFGLSLFDHQPTVAAVSAGNEDAARVESVIQYVPLMGSSYNVLKSGHDYNLGRASGAEVGFNTAMMVVDFASMAGGGPKGGNSGTTTLYRAIGESELDDVIRFGDFGLSPSQAGKYFAFTEKGAAEFASHPFNAGQRMTITSIEVPNSMLRRGHIFNDPGGAGRSIHFADGALPELYKAGGLPKILSVPWVPLIGP